jgi:hypothetical protein
MRLNPNKKEAVELVCTRSTVRPKCFYSCKYNTDRLLRTNLLTGEQSWYHYLVTSSGMAAVGVSCLDKAYSSLVELKITLQQGR